MSKLKALGLMGLGVVALGLTACGEPEAEALAEPGVCYHVTYPAELKGKPQFNVLTREQPQIEFCAARLEEMRLRFLMMGGSITEITGAYQGQYIFIDRGGVKFSKSLTGPRFFALARTGDGRLAIPGAIQRGIDNQPVAVAPN